MSKPRASVVEIIASGRKPTEDGGGSIVVPNEVRINGVSVFTTGNGVKISEFTLGDETVSVNLTLVVRKLTIAAASDLENSEPIGTPIAQAVLRQFPPPYRWNGPGLDEQADEGHPEPPSEDEPNDTVAVYPDPRQPAYDAVHEYIRRLGGYLPRDFIYRNAVIWQAVNAALGATPVGRCVSSHCVEGDHTLPVEGEES